MTAKQFSAALTQLGFNRTTFADLIDVTPRMVRNWANGHFPVPKQTALLVELMLKAQSMTEDLPS